jgi:spore germination cell wall hydrolase CwlJ-like protein
MFELYKSQKKALLGYISAASFPYAGAAAADLLRRHSTTRFALAFATAATVVSIAASNQLSYGYATVHPVASAGLRLRPRVSVGPPAPAITEAPPQIFRALTPQEAVAANAAVPISKLPNPAASPFAIAQSNAEDYAKALNCLTAAVYYEAASESAEGQAAVAQVVLNRLRHPLFPKTVCGVVFEGSSLPTGCQFTFTCDGSLDRTPSIVGWKQASEIAERALHGYVMKSVGEATHYHTVWVVPYWQPTVVKLTQIGAHIFYRWAGGMGSPRAFAGQYAGSEPATPRGLGPDGGAELQQALNDAAKPRQPVQIAEVQPLDLPAVPQGAPSAPELDAPPAPIAPPIPPKPPAKPSFFGAPRGGGGPLPW